MSDSLWPYGLYLSIYIYKFIYIYTHTHTGEGNGTLLQYSCLENPMDGGALRAAVHAVVKSRTGRSDFTFTLPFRALEKEMSTHSSVLAWRIPGTGEPGGLPSMGVHRVGHDWSDLAAAAYTRTHTILCICVSVRLYKYVCMCMCLCVLSFSILSDFLWPLGL